MTGITNLIKKLESHHLTFSEQKKEMICKDLLDEALLPIERATKIILAAYQCFSNTKVMIFIENDAEYLLRWIPADIKTVHCHDDKAHLRQKRTLSSPK